MSAFVTSTLVLASAYIQVYPYISNLPRANKDFNF